MTNSLKADNPISIDFSAFTSSTVSISSNAPVYLAGTISQGSGQTTISATGSITAAAEASISTPNLSLTATGGIGTSSEPLDVILTGDKVLNTQAGNQGVYLNLNSAANIGQITAGRILDPIITRANTDGYVGQVYINNQTFSGQQPVAFSFYAKATGNYVTPLLFSVNDGTYTLAAVYQSIQVNQTGVNSTH